MSRTDWLDPGETELLDARVLRERAAIQDVVVAAGLLLDAGDFDMLRTLYTADAVFQMDPAPEGYPSVLTTPEQIMMGFTYQWNHARDEIGVMFRHVTSNLLITSLGPATAEVYSIFTVTGLHTDGQLGLRRLGNYVDRLRREGTRWRIAHRTVHMSAPPPLRAAEPEDADMTRLGQ
ncbi:nuclear transport factor 2 family protein [Micromonospora sp. NPDC051925]|uniref:nuclear transport factor 2 family protein n=1 Tax=Micromonospora sp. NPDC051925 TaxID=3364288 RepID=UPI0037C86379